MSFFNDAQKDALLTGRYICSKCGARMQFEDEWEDILVCLECGHSVELERFMWALKMKPIKRERWETVFDRRGI